LAAVDLAVLVGYLVLTVGLGFLFARRAGQSDRFMAGDRNLPAWAVGMSIFGSYVSSISFLANPGSSYAGNWNPFVFSLATPFAAYVAIKWFVPFYRKSGEVSAYHHLEQRFGNWARTYAVVCYLLTQLARTGTIIYLLAIAVAPLTGWSPYFLILMTGSMMTIYTVVGGMEALMWIGVLHSLVLLAGPLICLAALAAVIPGGLSAVFPVAAAHDKFSLGSFSPDLTTSTVWVVLAYGFVINLANFAVDQGYIQRYITAESDKAAARSVWLGSLLYVPVAAIFFLIGTSLFAWTQLVPAAVPAGTVNDQVFPWFIATQLPIGMAGIVVAGIFAAALDPSLNSMATLILRDIYQGYIDPTPSERTSVWILRLTTCLAGVLATIVALAMTQVASILKTWWELAGIFNGGVLGLILLARLPKERLSSRWASLAVNAGIFVVLWMTLSPRWADAPAWAKNPLHPFMTPVIGTIVILGIGLLGTIRDRGVAICWLIWHTVRRLPPTD